MFVCERVCDVSEKDEAKEVDRREEVVFGGGESGGEEVGSRFCRADCWCV